MKKIIKGYCQWDDEVDMKYCSPYFTWQVALNNYKAYVAEEFDNVAKNMKEIQENPPKEIVINNAAIFKNEWYLWSINDEEINP